MLNFTILSRNQMNQKKIRYSLICIRLSTCKIRRLCLKYREDLNFYFSCILSRLTKKKPKQQQQQSATYKFGQHLLLQEP